MIREPKPSEPCICKIHEEKNEDKRLRVQQEVGKRNELHLRRMSNGVDLLKCVVEKEKWDI